MSAVVELLRSRRMPQIAVLALISVGFAGCSADMSTRLSQNSYSENPFAFDPQPTGAVPSQPVERKLNVIPDKIQAYGLDVSSAISGDHGLVWAAVQEGDPIAQSRPYGRNLTRSTIVQVTNLGVSVKDSPLNTLVMVTRLDDAKPVAGAKVSLRTTDNAVCRVNASFIPPPIWPLIDMWTVASFSRELSSWRRARLLASASGSGCTCVVTRIFFLSASTCRRRRARGFRRVLRSTAAALPAAVCTHDSTNAVILWGIIPPARLDRQAGKRT